MVMKSGVQFTEKLYGDIQELYSERLKRWVKKREELENYFKKNLPCREEELCIKFLYSCAPVQDLLSFSPEWFFLQVKQALKAAENLTFFAQVPEIIWLKYVLMYRINDETPDLSRKTLYQELFSRVKDKSIREAALAVNEWCCSRVSYEPADDRTLGVEGILKRGAGRCGEESTLVTAALRSVGIPARQCYAVKWAHCDDNHAWVEAWTGDGWHYMGACEPEPELDRGWFTSAASRAMMIRTRSWSLLPNQAEEEEEEKPAGNLFSWINVTGRYGHTGILRVKVTDRASEKRGVQVKFYVVNYSRLSVIYQGTTDDCGIVSCKFGLGELYVEAWDGKKLCGKKVSLQSTDQDVIEIHLDMEEGYRPDHEAHSIHFSLKPPKEKIFSEEDPADSFQRRLLQLDRQRAERREQWKDCGIVERKSRGNWKEIRLFLELKDFSDEEKSLLLSTLNEKDLSDCTRDGLKELLETALPYRNRYPSEVWAEGILNPRVSREFLWPVRKQLSEELCRTGVKFTDFRRIQEYIEENLQILDADGFEDWTGNPLEMLKQKAAVRSDIQVLLINCCRSLGIAARYSENLGMVEIWENGGWMPADKKQHVCKVILKSREFIDYGSQATVSIWQDGCFRALENVEAEENYPEQVRSVTVRPGFCRILTSRRQIDGEISCQLRDIEVQDDIEIFLSLEKDKTLEKRKREAITYPGNKRVVIFADPGKEPTEHLLQELLLIQEELKENQIEIDILLQDGADQKQETLLQVLKELWHAKLRNDYDYPPVAQLRNTMGVGDRRLPFVMAVDEEGMGRFAFANYQIGTAAALLNILRG